MLAPRKRFTTKKLAPRHSIPLRSQNSRKSIANPNQPRAPQLIENKTTSQKSIANFLALLVLTQEGRAPRCGGRMGLVLRLILHRSPSARKHRQINRNIDLIEPLVSRCKQRTQTKINRNISATLSSRQRATFRSHLIDGFRQGTASAVPVSPENSGVSTPEGCGRIGRRIYETSSRHLPLSTSFAIVCPPKIAKEAE
jgi:hypothetical protein